jgi:hypothetical protein
VSGAGRDRYRICCGVGDQFHFTDDQRFGLDADDDPIRG